MKGNKGNDGAMSAFDAMGKTAGADGVTGHGMIGSELQRSAV